MDPVTSKCADYSAAKSERIPISDPPAVFTVMSSTSCVFEHGNLVVCETAIDSDSSKTKVSGMAGPSND